MNLAPARTPLDKALDDASRARLGEIELRIGMPIHRLRSHNNRGLAGWIKREIADTLGHSAAKLFPEGERYAR